MVVDRSCNQSWLVCAGAWWRRRGTSACRRRRGLRGAVVALGVCLLCLSACRIDAKVEFKADGSQYTEIVFEDDTNSMRTLEQTCEDLREYFGTTSRYAAAAKMEDVTSPGGHLRCKATSSVSHDEVTVKDSGDTFSVSMKSSPPDGGDLSGLTMTTTITMPGKVIKSSVGKVRGNTVVIDGFDYPITGFTITSRKGGAASPAAGSTAGKSRTAAPAGRHGAQAGWSVWVWIGGGCAALIGLAVGGTAIFRASRRRKHQAAALVQSVSARSGAASPRPFGNPDWPR